MYVLDRLTSVVAYVAYYTVSFFETERLGDFRNCGENICDFVGVRFAYFVGGGNMALRNYKTVYGCLRIYIEERIAMLVLVNLL
jgi:hypothetical protein